MLNVEDYTFDKSLYCKTDPLNVHILNEPMLLPCNNSICKKCIDNFVSKNKTLFNCNYCSQIHYIKSTNELKANSRFFDEVKANLMHLSTNLMGKLQEYKSILQETFKERDSILKNCIDYQKEAILIRIESIKIELDKLCDSLYSSLDEIKIQIKLELDNLDGELSGILIKNEKLIETMNIEIENFKQNEQNLFKNLYKCEENLNEMQNFNKTFSNKLQKINFNVNDEWLPNVSIIGDLRKIEKNPIEKLKISLPKKLDLDPLNVQLVSGMCGFQNEKFYLVDTDANEILILNKKFELIERVKQIEGEKFNYPLNICTDNRENVYLCDYNNSRVILMDHNLRVIKKTITTTSDYISSPIDICFYGDCLFILDNTNSNIKQFLRDGAFVRDINLHDNFYRLLKNPVRLTIIDNLIAVLENWKKIYLFDFDGNYRDSIEFNDVEIYTVYFFYGCLYCIDKLGKFSCCQIVDNKVEILFQRILPFSEANSDYMTLFDNKLIIAYCYSNFLAIFDLD